MQNKLKPQSPQVIQQLRTANIKCVMVTGTHALRVHKKKFKNSKKKLFVFRFIRS